jgi:hypothetical protein
MQHLLRVERCIAGACQDECSKPKNDPKILAFVCKTPLDPAVQARQ